MQWRWSTRCVQLATGRYSSSARCASRLTLSGHTGPRSQYAVRTFDPGNLLLYTCLLDNSPPDTCPADNDPLDISPWTCALRSPDVRPLLTKAPQKRLNVMVMCLTIVTLSAGSKNTKILGAGVLRATVWGRDECPTFCQKNGDSVTRNIV